MMRKISLFSSLLVLLVCIACNNPNTFVLPTSGKIREMIRVDSLQPRVLFPDQAEQMYITDMKKSVMPRIVDVKYLPLDNNIGFISHVKKILFIKNRIIIFDFGGDGNDAIFIFDNLGAGIKKLPSGGRGPMEFFRIGDVYTFPGSSYFSVADFQSSRIQTFDLNGNHVRTEHTSLHMTYRHPLSDSVILYSSNFNQNYHVDELFSHSIFTGVGDSILFRGLPFLPHQKSSWRTNYFFTNYRGGFQLRQHGGDSIFEVINDSTYFVPFVVEFENSVQNKLMQYPPGSDYLGLYWVYTGKDYKSLGGFLENDNSIFYLVRGKVGLRAYLFNKSSGISYQINEPLLQNPLTFICVGAIPVTIHENKFVSPLPGYMVYLFNPLVSH